MSTYSPHEYRMGRKQLPSTARSGELKIEGRSPSSYSSDELGDIIECYAARLHFIESKKAQLEDALREVRGSIVQVDVSARRRWWHDVPREATFWWTFAATGWAAFIIAACLLIGTWIEIAS